jgi:hypothetical protein
VILLGLSLGLGSARFGATADVAAVAQPALNPHVSELWVWVPNRSSTSCDLDIFVYQPIEQIATSEAKLGRRCRRW